MSSRIAKLLGIGVALLGALGCSSKPASDSQESVRVLIAASTKEAVEEVAAAFTRKTGVKVTLVAESSSRLATQIVHDAPADLFLSANQKWADFVKEKGYSHDAMPLLTNNLVLIVPKGNPAGVKQPTDLVGAAVQRVALAGPAVPAGTYARQALMDLGLLDALEKGRKIAVGDDVRVTLTFVERGEAEAGVVYDTDARITDRVEVVHTFAPSTHEPIRYPLVLLRDGQARPRAVEFYEFLQSPEAARVFAKHGFTPLTGK